MISLFKTNDPIFQLVDSHVLIICQGHDCGGRFRKATFLKPSSREFITDFSALVCPKMADILISLDNSD